MNLSEELVKLKEEVIHMSDLVLNNLNIALKMLLTNTNKEYNIDDDIIDQEERKLEQKCMHLLLVERPFARDLRVISGILKLISDLERLGDHALDIENLAKKINFDLTRKENIFNMAKVSLEMVRDSIKAYIDNDSKLSEEVIKKDDYIDDMFNVTLSNVVDYINGNTLNTKDAINVVLAIKYLERISDHAVNICEWVIYINSGFHKDKVII